MQETKAQFLGWEDPLEKGMAIHGVSFCISCTNEIWKKNNSYFKQCVYYGKKSYKIQILNAGIGMKYISWKWDLYSVYNMNSHSWRLCLSTHSQ